MPTPTPTAGSRECSKGAMPIRRSRFAWTLPCLLAAQVAAAEDPPAGAAPAHPGATLERRSLDPAYEGLVVNQTISSVGHDFYQAFVAAWREMPLNERYALTIGERPSARLGSQVWVEFSQRRIFQAVLPPARARIASVGAAAAELVHQRVVDSEVERLLFRDPDLGPDEI